jgi:hypothetical protein
MGQATSTSRNNNNLTGNLLDQKNNVYKAALTDDHLQFSHFYNLLTTSYPEILLDDVDFIVWILTTAIHKRSMNVLKFIKFDTNLFNDQKIFEEVIEDILSQHDLRETDTLLWILQNGPTLSEGTTQRIVQFLEGSALGKGKLQKIFEFIKKGEIQRSSNLEELIIFHE